MYLNITIQVCIIILLLFACLNIQSYMKQRTIYFLVRVLNILTENGSYFCWQKYEPWFLLQTGMRVN